MYFTLIDGMQSILHSFLVTGSCCCIAAFVFFFALVVYSWARGSVLIRVGNRTMGSRPRSYGNTYTQDTYPHTRQEPEELKAIRGAEKILCDHCGSWVDSTESKCPSCGAPLEKN